MQAYVSASWACRALKTPGSESKLIQKSENGKRCSIHHHRVSRPCSEHYALFEHYVQCIGSRAHARPRSRVIVCEVTHQIKSGPHLYVSIRISTPMLDITYDGCTKARFEKSNFEETQHDVIWGAVISWLQKTKINSLIYFERTTSHPHSTQDDMPPRKHRNDSWINPNDSFNTRQSRK